MILWENANTQYYYAVTEQCYVGSSHSTCKMIIIVSVLNGDQVALLCLFHSDSHIHIDQETNIGGYYLNKNMGEI